MKTPDEIKKGLECSDCKTCPYDDDCTTNVKADALAYIQQLERDNAKKHEKIMQLNIALEDMQGIVQSITQDSKQTFQQLEAENHQLLTKVEQLERERDAAVADVRASRTCGSCKRFTETCSALCLLDPHRPKWEWRGVKEE